MLCCILQWLGLVEEHNVLKHRFQLLNHNTQPPKPSKEVININAENKIR